MVMLTVITLNSCREEDPQIQITKGQSQMHFDADGGEATVSIETNYEWTLVTSAGDWFSVSPRSGSAGTSTISVKVQPSKENQERSASITIDCRGLSVKVNVKQDAFTPTFKVDLNDPDALHLPQEGGAFSINISTNVSYEVYTDADWIKESGTKAIEQFSHTFTAEANPGYETRVAHVTFFNEIGETHSFSVYQEPVSVLELSSTKINAAATAGCYYFNISSNVGWTTECDADWCHVDPEDGYGDSMVSVCPSENFETTSRSATVTVATTDGKVRQTLTLNQKGSEPYIGLEIGNIYLDSSESSASFNILSNIDWKASSDSDWCKLSATSGSRHGEITVSATENPSVDKRTAKVKISSKDGSITSSLNVIQDGAEPYLTVSEEDLRLAAVNGKATLEIKSNASWTIETYGNWFDCDVLSGKGDRKLTITALDNVDTFEQSGAIIITAGSLISYITLSQEAAQPALTVSSSSLKFGCEYSSLTLSISSNTGWHIKNECDWLFVMTTNGYKDQEVSIIALDNVSLDSRGTSITVVTNDDSVSRTVSVSQDGFTPYINVDPESIELPYGQSNAYVGVESNWQWTAQSNDESWCTIEVLGASGIRVNATENKTGKDRKAQITIKSEGSSVTKKVNVTQKAFNGTEGFEEGGQYEW